MPSSLNNPATEFSATSPILNNVFAIKTVIVGGETYLVTGGAGGMSVYRFDPDTNLLTQTEEIFDGGTDAAGSTINELTDIRDLTIVEDGTNVWVLAAVGEGALTSFSLSATGELTRVDTDIDGDATGGEALTNVYGVATATVNGTTYVYTGGDEDQLEVFELNTTTGALTYNATLSVADDNLTAGNANDVSKLENIRAIETTEAGGNSYMAVYSAEGAITLFDVASDGTLSSLDVEHHGTTETGSTVTNNLNVPGDLIWATVGSQTFLVSSEAEGGGAIQVYELDTVNGTLTNVFSIADGGLDAAGGTVTGIRDVESLSAVETSFGTFIHATSQQDDSATIFKLDGSGGLTFDSQTVDDAGTAYDNSLSNHVFVADDGNFHYVQGGLEGMSTHNFVPCFTPGTLILTDHGEVPVEDLRIGDRVVTLDHGAQVLRWIGIQTVCFGGEPEKMKPVLIPAGCLGNGQPKGDLAVSSQHRFLVRDSGFVPRFSSDEVLVAAKAFVGWHGIQVLKGKREATYHSLLFDHHEIVFAEGCLTESFFPGPYAMANLPRALRDDAVAHVPSAHPDHLTGYGHPARPLVKVREGREMICDLDAATPNRTLTGTRRAGFRHYHLLGKIGL